MNPLFILIHVLSVLDSCSNIEQVNLTIEWGAKVIKNEDDRDWFLKLATDRL